MASEDLRNRLSGIGLDKTNVDNISKKEELAKSIVGYLDELEVKECDKSIGMLLYTVFTKANAKHRKLLGEYVKAGKIKTSNQCDAACKFVTAAGDSDVNAAELEKACGVGVEVTEEQIRAAVAKAVEERKEAIEKERYRYNQGRLLGELRKVEELKWADAQAVKQELEKQIEALLGPKTEADLDDGKKKKKDGKDDKAPAGQAAEKPQKEITSPEKQKEMIDRALNGDCQFIADIREHAGKDVLVRGWVHKLRLQGKLTFVVLRDGTGFMQCVVPHAFDVPRETSVVFAGKVKEDERAKKSSEGCVGYELKVEDLALVGGSNADLENLINADTKPHEYFNQRHLALRSYRTGTLQRVRSFTLQAFRAHFASRRCMEMQPPTIVQTQCEGGSALFELKSFYGEPAYLTQSSQLYLETAIPVVGDCFCILPSYRAEESKTKRHLSEFCHIEAEYPFINFEKLLSNLEDLVVDVVGKLMDWCGEEIRSLNPEPAKDWVDDGTDGWKQCYIPKKPFKRLPHADAIKFCREHGIKKTLDDGTQVDFDDEDDIPDAPERAMVEMIGEPVFMTKFPASIKSFYMKRCEGAGEGHLTESVDLLMPGVGEIIGGSMRIHDYDELMRAYEINKLDPVPYYWFTDQRKYGTTPHGGFGLGLERFLVWLCNVDHVRETCMFPRLMGRCTP